jgi:hypothetical protein
MKKLLSVLVGVSLSACSTFPAVNLPNLADNPQALVGPTANHAVPALVAAWRAYDALLTFTEGLIAAGVLERNSPRAMTVRGIEQRMLAALRAATEAVRAGNATDYANAMTLAQQAFTEAKNAVGAH